MESGFEFKGNQAAIVKYGSIRLYPNAIVKRDEYLKRKNKRTNENL